MYNRRHPVQEVVRLPGPFLMGYREISFTAYTKIQKNRTTEYKRIDRQHTDNKNTDNKIQKTKRQSGRFNKHKSRHTVRDNGKPGYS